jgi:hypothetical protein
MNDEQELLPDDLDALIDDLQKGTPPMVPNAQQPEAAFVRNVVNAAHATTLDIHFANKLNARLKTDVALVFPRNQIQLRLAMIGIWQSWRGFALAFTSVILVSLLAISSMINPGVQPVGLTPVLAYATQDYQATDYSSLDTTHDVASLTATDAQRHTDGTPLQAVQAPEPPHTPFPTLTARSEPFIKH